jgi:Cu(I)/Ag(I) efflux system membrane protein CusA/SilA
VIILIYMDHALRAITQRRQAAGERISATDVHDAVIQGALLRVRPIMMTVFAITAGLLPIMWGSGTGSEVMRRIAAPMIGGIVSATVLALVVIPAVYFLWNRRALQHVKQYDPVDPNLAPAE